MEHCLLSNKILDCINTGIPEKHEKCLLLFNKYIDAYYFDLEVFETGNEIFEKFLFIWLPSCASFISLDIIDSFISSLNFFCEFSGLTVTFDNNFPNNFTRILKAKKEFDKFLYHPVIGVEPFVIDFLIYKKYKEQITLRKKYNYFETGYFEVADIYMEKSIILKKIGIPPLFVKLVLDKNIASYLKVTDIFYLKIRRQSIMNPWEIEYIKGIYPQFMQKLLFHSG